MFKRLLTPPQDRSFFLFGPRQVGKSTILAQNFSPKTTLIFDLLDPDTYNPLLRNPSVFKDEIRARNPQITHVIIDEIQKLPNLLDQVHMILENDLNPPFFCLTGSSARKLKKSGVNLLGGRAWTLNLSPLIYQEFVLNNNAQFNLDEALSYGTLPSIYLEQDQFKKTQDLKAYVNTYLKEEIKEEALVRNVSGFSNFLRFAAEENGNILNYNNIARAVGVDSKTIKEYFSILEDTLVGFYLRPLTSSHRTRLIKHPKFYFFDTGVQRALTNQLSLKLERRTTQYGKAFEHFIIKEIMNYSSYQNKDFEFSFYRTESGSEIDLIIRKPCGKHLAIEIKASNEPELKDLKAFFGLEELIPNSTKICVSLAPRKRYLKDILVCPWQEIWEIFG